MIQSRDYRAASLTSDWLLCNHDTEERLQCLHTPRKARPQVPIMCSFYFGAIQSILTTWWKLPASRSGTMLRLVKIALPPTHKAVSITVDSTHPSHSFPQGQDETPPCASSTRLRNRYISRLNSLPHKHKATTPHCTAPVISIYPVLHLILLAL